MAQEMGYDNEGGAMTETYRGLQDNLEENPLRDGNKWLEALMRHPDNNMRLTALRLLEVRKAYASGQFDFADMHELAVLELCKENDKLMADYVTVGLYKLNPLIDPQLESAWFQPLKLKCENRVSNFAFFQNQLVYWYRYVTDSMNVSMGEETGMDGMKQRGE